MAARTIRAVPLLAIVLPIHIALAIALFVPALLLPFALRTDRPATESRSRLVRFLLRMQGGGSVLNGIGLVVTGAVLALFIQRPNLRALVGLRAAWDDRTWLAAARRQRYVSYAMAGLIGLIGYLMSAKPQL